MIATRSLMLAFRVLFGALIYGLLIFGESHAMPRIFHPEVQLAGGGTFFSGIGRTCVDNRVQIQLKRVGRPEYIFPYYCKVKHQLVSVFPSVSFHLNIIYFNSRSKTIFVNKNDFLETGPIGRNRLEICTGLHGVDPTTNARPLREANYAIDGRLAEDSNVTCRGLTRVPKFNSRGDTLSVDAVLRRVAVQVGSGLSFTDFTGNNHSVLSGLRCILRFVNGASRMFRGITSMEQRAPNQNDSDAGQEYTGAACPKHKFCPKSHFLLGLQVGGFALLLSLTCYLIFFGYQIANSGFDALDRGQKIVGAVRFWSGILLACIVAGGLPAGGYWLAFEGGLWRILS